MKDYEQIRVSRQLLSNVQHGTITPDMPGVGEKVTRVLVPPEVREEIKVNCTMSAFDMAELPKEILERHVREQLVHAIAEQIYDKVDIAVGHDLEFASVTYYATFVAELVGKEYKND